ncbi:MAG: histidine kinase [Nitrosomonadales bacterium]|nr:histidine kinase [Nitrosomonadales bacterium]
MNKARSIKQNDRPDALPNFRNLGITLRILLISIGLALLLAFMQASAWRDVPQQMMQIATIFTPVLLLSLLLLWAAQPRLERLSYLHGALAVTALPLLLTWAIYYLGNRIFDPVGGNDNYFNAARYGLFAITVCALLLLYFWLRSQALSSALHDARLQALRARIRPHFLFNTINTVLSIIRTQPREAETALENMADLFRMAMSDMQDLVPIHKEIQLSRQYAELEQLRMGERLGISWKIEGVPQDALIPPLLLQPLLENAVYHGIEPLPKGGNIDIVLRCNGDEVQIRVENPCAPHNVRQRMDDTTGSYNLANLSLQPTDKKPHKGNKMALHNIRERLALLFDSEARYKVETGKDFYRVEIVLPYVKERPL